MIGRSKQVYSIYIIFTCMYVCMYVQQLYDYDKLCTYVHT